MHPLHKMIQELCPNGVKWVKLGEVAEVGTGSGNRQDAVNKGAYPFYVRSQEVLQSNSYEFDEEAIIIPGEGGIGDIFHYVNEKYFLHQRAYRIHLLSDDISTKFLFYYFKTNFKTYILSKSLNAAVSSIRKPMLLDFDIPLPPLPIQEEIVKTLDTFSALLDNIDEEIAQREKQYEYYREKLLTFKEGECEWKKLVTFAKVLRGKRLTKNMLSSLDKYPVYHGGLEPIGFYYENNRSANTVMIINVGASAGTIGYCNVDFWSSDGCFCIEKTKQVNDKYLFHIFKIKEGYIQSKVRNAGIPTLDNNVIENISIPLPSPSRQAEIVKTLDAFEAIINNLKAEREQRQKQYEYYREALLNFKNDRAI